MTTPTMSRRRWLQAAAVAAGLGAYTWRVEPHWLEIVRRPLPIVGLPDPLRGRTLAHLSDLHVGHRVDDDYVRDTFARIQALSPDIVAYTGDFTDFHPEVFTQAARVYASAARGRLATVGIFGNHDYGPGWRHPEVAARLVPILERCGIQILRNAVADISGLLVVGLDDLWAKQFAAEPALLAWQQGRPALVLSHNPDTLDVGGWGDYRGWVLSGHTHGGQCRPPFLPPPIVPVLNKRYTAGEIVVDDRRRVYISRGVGHTTRVRFNVRPEVTLFELVPAENG